MRSPSALEIARFLQKAAEGDFLVSYCLSGVHKNWYIIRAMRQNSKKGLTNLCFGYILVSSNGYIITD